MPQTDASTQQKIENLHSPLEIKVEIERIRNSDPFIQLQRERDLFAWLDNQSDTKSCGCLLAGKRAGLKKACKYYRIKHVKSRGKLQEIPASVVYVEMYQFGSPTDLYKTILESLSHPLSRTGKLRDLRKRAWGTLKKYGVKLLIVDNADYLTLESFNELTDIFDDRSISIVLAGTYNLSEILSRNSSKYINIHNYFLGFHHFRPLSRDETKLVIDSWESNVLKNWSPRLDLAADTQIVQQLHSKSDGLIEVLYELLRLIAIWKLKDNAHKIDAKIIEQVLNNRSPAQVKATRVI